MTEPSKRETQTKQSDKLKPAVLLTLTALNTTWRMFVPIGAGTIIGLLLDHALHTVAIWTIILLFVGAALSAYLVYRQLKAVRS